MIVNLLNKLYYNVTYIEEKKSGEISSFRQLVIKVIKKSSVFLVWFVSFLQFKFLLKGDFSGKENEEVIVSLTSFPARIGTVWLTVYSILKQTVKPKEIVLYLSKDEFPNKHKSIPRKLLKLEKYGLKICFVEGNLRSHKKYYYALQEYKNSHVITIDDDLYYPTDTISRLINLSEKFPSLVCANVATHIKLENDNKPASYIKWFKTHEEFCVNRNFVAIGHGGVLYPKNVRPELFFNETLFKNLAFHADDLWLKAVELEDNIDVAVGSYFPHPMVIPSTQKNALKNKNTQGSILNDSQWEKLTEKFNIKLIE